MNFFEDTDSPKLGDSILYINKKYKSKKAKKNLFNSMLDISCCNIEEDDDSTIDFDQLCDQFIQNFESQNYAALNNLIETMKIYASQINNPILIEFEKYNFAYYLTQYLNIDETPNTAILISYCVAHEDEISTYFIKSGFLSKASELFNDYQFISPILLALRNIAACSFKNIHLLLNSFSYDRLIQLAKAYNDNENILEKIICLLMNLSQYPPVPVDVFHFFTETLYNSPFLSVHKSIFWCIHYSLMHNTKLKKACIEDELPNYIIDCIKAETQQDFLYVQINIITDLIQILPEYFDDFDINIIIPFFYSDNKLIVKSSMNFFEEIAKKNIKEIINDDFLELFRNILDESNYKIKYDILCILTSIIINNLAFNNLISLINQGVVEILDNLFEFDDTNILKQLIKSLTRLLNAAFLNNQSQAPEFGLTSPFQILGNQFEELNIYEKIEEIYLNTKDDNLASEINIFMSEYKNKILGIANEEEDDDFN